MKKALVDTFFFIDNVMDTKRKDLKRMGNDSFLEAWNEIGNPSSKSFITYVRSSIDRTVFAVYKNPGDEELDELRATEKRYMGMSWGFKFGIYKKDKYVWPMYGSHDDVQRALAKTGIIQGNWNQTGEIET